MATEANQLWVERKMAKILIVDDSPFARTRLKQLFESNGHEVVGLAEDGAQAFALFKSLHPEIVTLDYLLGEVNGDEVLKEIIQFDPDARVIMLSGSDDSSIKERSLKDGAKAFVEKFNLQRDVLKALDQVMEM